MFWSKKKRFKKIQISYLIARGKGGRDKASSPRRTHTSTNHKYLELSGIALYECEPTLMIFLDFIQFKKGIEIIYDRMKTKFFSEMSVDFWTGRYWCPISSKSIEKILKGT